jgi:hypothetical protein
MNDSMPHDCECGVVGVCVWGNGRVCVVVGLYGNQLAAASKGDMQHST